MTPVGALLQKAELVSERDVDRALERQAREGGRLLRNLFALGAISRPALYRFLASQGVPTLSPLNCRVSTDVIELLPPEFVVQHEMIPVDRMGPMMTVVMLYPWDRDAIRAAESLTGLRVNAFLCDGDEFATAYHRFYSRSLEDDVASAAAKARGEEDTYVIEDNMSAYDSTSLRTDVSEIDELPVLAATINRISHTEHITPAKLTECITQDVAAAAIVLRDANTLRKGGDNSVLTIDEAVRVLGVEAACDAILSAPVAAKSSDRITEEYVRVQRESVSIAALAQNIAASCGEDLAGPAYETALLANIGRLALIELVRREHHGIMDYESPERFRGMTEAVSQSDIAATGAQLATAWGLPKVFVESIRRMRTPTLARQYRKTAALIHLADTIVRRTNALLENESDSSLETLGYSAAVVQRALWPNGQYKTVNVTPVVAAFA